MDAQPDTLKIPTWQCDQNMQQNTPQFLYEIAIYLDYIFCISFKTNLLIDTTILTL